MSHSFSLSLITKTPKRMPNDGIFNETAIFTLIITISSIVRCRVDKSFSFDIIKSLCSKHEKFVLQESYDSIGKEKHLLDDDFIVPIAMEVRTRCRNR